MLLRAPSGTVVLCRHEEGLGDRGAPRKAWGARSLGRSALKWSLRSRTRRRIATRERCTRAIGSCICGRGAIRLSTARKYELNVAPRAAGFLVHRPLRQRRAALRRPAGPRRALDRRPLVVTTLRGKAGGARRGHQRATRGGSERALALRRAAREPVRRVRPRSRRFATEVGDPGRDDLVAWYLHAGTTIKQKFTYDTDATSVQTTVDESIRRAGRGLPGLRPRPHRAVPLLRRAGPLRERLRLQRTGGLGARRRGLPRLVRGVPAARRVGRLRPDQRHPHRRPVRPDRRRARLPRRQPGSGGI